MSKPDLNLLYGDSFAEKQAGTGMPTVMEAMMPNKNGFSSGNYYVDCEYKDDGKIKLLFFTARSDMIGFYSVKISSAPIDFSDKKMYNTF